MIIDRHMIEGFLNDTIAYCRTNYGTTAKLQIYSTSTTVPTDMNYDTISGNVGGVYTPLLTTPFTFDFTSAPTCVPGTATLVLPFPVTLQLVGTAGTPAFYILYSDTGGWIGGSGKAIWNLGDVTVAAGAGPLKVSGTFPLTVGDDLTITAFEWSLASLTVV